MMWYLSVVSLVFLYWLGLFFTDEETPKDSLISWIVLIMASLLWPLSVPGAIIELASKVKSNQEPDNTQNNQNIIL